MYKIDDSVRIISTGELGTIADISSAGGTVLYMVDTDTGDDEDYLGGGMPRVAYCREDELEPV